VRLRTYDRELTTDLRVVREKSQLKAGRTYRPFRAVSPAQLATLGYVLRDNDGSYVFNAPDADVLFSDEFLNAHCFRAERVRDSSTAGLVGLGFEPVGGSRVPDIRGTMWLDEKSAELRYVQFRYVNHGLGIETDVIGGRVEFGRLSNGAWIVNRYWIRMPILNLVREKQFRNIGQAASGGGNEVSRTELAGLQEQGGEIMDAFANDGTRLATALGATLTGAVFDSTRGIPLIGAEVRLAGTEYVTQSGPGGEFRIEGIPEGTYSVEFKHRDFPAWGILPGPAAVQFTPGVETHVALNVPPQNRLYALLCPDLKSDTLSIVAGVVRDSATAKPVKDAVVQLSWQTYDVVRSEQISGRRFTVEVGSDSTGYFRRCGVPARGLIVVQAVVQGRPGPASEPFQVQPGEIKEVDLTN
jgi:hypothetical protein